MTARRIILIGTALVLGVYAQAQSVRFFVNDDTNLLESATSFDSVATPTGYTVVAKTVVDAACSCDSTLNGTWDGTTYESHEDLTAPTTDAERLMVGAFALHHQLLAWSEALENVASYWPQADVHLGHDLLAYAHRGVRGVILSDSWTLDQKLTFMEQMAIGASDVTSPGEFFERIEEGDDVDDPSESRTDHRVLWVNPDTGLRVTAANCGRMTPLMPNPGRTARPF